MSQSFSFLEVVNVMAPVVDKPMESHHDIAMLRRNLHAIEELGALKDLSNKGIFIHRFFLRA